jgi:hypothetical protein
MRKLALVLTTLTIASLPAGAFAATLGLNTNATTSTKLSAGSTSTSVNTSTAATINGSLSEKSNFSEVMATLSSPNTSASVDFTTIHAKHIKFVLVGKLSGYLTSGLKISQANMKNKTALDAKVAADATLTAALKKHGYTSSEVVAVATDAKSDLTVFVAK